MIVRHTHNGGGSSLVHSLEWMKMDANRKQVAPSVAVAACTNAKKTKKRRSGKVAPQLVSY